MLVRFSSLTFLVALLLLQTDYSNATRLPPSSVNLLPILTTTTSTFTLSSTSTDAKTGQQICNLYGGHLLSVSSNEDLESLKKAITLDVPFWTSGIRYSNSTVENLLVWSSTHEAFPFPLTPSDLDNLRLAGEPPEQIRNRRAAIEIKNNDDCPCPCPPTPAPLPPPPPCKRSTCQGFQPACKENQPRTCEIAHPPDCAIQGERNCTVDCGRPEDCRVLEQPVCTIVPSSKPYCRIENPNPGNCITIKPQECHIVAPGFCHSLAVDCRQEHEPPCVPVIKPCKKPCSESECTSVQPPCTVHQPPCVSTPAPCSNETAPAPDCLARCKRSTSDKESRYNCEQTCIAPSPGTNCDNGNVTVCPPPVSVCPEPVSTCTKPLVDCSPIICQSNVQICPPTKVHCGPPIIRCEDPKIQCNDPVLECPEAEVICDSPEVKCTKPLIKCPDPVVNCDPVITTCEPVTFNCTKPDLTCPDPEITCEEAVTCPVPPSIKPPQNGGGNCPCNSGGKMCGANRKVKRETIPSDNVETTECIALTGSSQKTKWIAQNCNLKHRFICQLPF